MKKNIIKRIFVVILYIVIFFFFTVIAIMIFFQVNNSNRLSPDELVDERRCKEIKGDWIVHYGSFDRKAECGLVGTKDGGKACIIQSDCILSCVESDPLSDHSSFHIEKKGDNYYYVSGEFGVCQTHESFLDDKTYRKLFKKKRLLTPDELPDYENIIRGL